MDIFNVLSPMQWGILAVAVVAIVAINWKSIGGWLAKPQATDTVTEPDQDVADMLALKRLTKRYAELNCPEGVQAMQTAAAHFFHEPGHAAPHTHAARAIG